MFDDLFQIVEDAITSLLSDNIVAMIIAIRPLMGAAVTLYAVYLVYESFYKDEANVKDIIKFLIALSFVTSIALSASYYLSTIVPIVSKSGENLATQVIGTDGSGTILTSMLNGLVDKIAEIADSINFDPWSGETYINAALKALMILVYMLGGTVFLGVAVAYLLVAKIMVFLLLIVGPIFIMMAFFPVTRSSFQAWTGQVFNYFLLTLVYPTVFSIFSVVIDKLVLDQEPTLAAAFLASLIFLAAILVSVQIPAFCSTLSGGVGISGIVSSALSTANPINVMKNIGKGAKKTKAGMSKLYNKTKPQIKP